MRVGHVRRNQTSEEEVEEHRRNRQQQTAAVAMSASPILARSVVGRRQPGAEAGDHPDTVPSKPIIGAGGECSSNYDDHHFRLGAEASSAARSPSLSC
jgi:hypothetical protein